MDFIWALCLFFPFALLSFFKSTINRYLLKVETVLNTRMFFHLISTFKKSENHQYLGKLLTFSR